MAKKLSREQEKAIFAKGNGRIVAEFYPKTSEIVEVPFTEFRKYSNPDALKLEAAKQWGVATNIKTTKLSNREKSLFQRFRDMKEPIQERRLDDDAGYKEKRDLNIRAFEGNGSPAAIVITSFYAGTGNGDFYGILNPDEPDIDRVKKILLAHD